MNQNACIDIEELEYDGRTFYKSSFMDISVIRSDAMFYNATRICQDNGYSGFGQVSRLENWKRHFNAMLTHCKIDPISKKITRMQILHSGETSENIKLIPLTEDDLIFEIKNQQGVHAWINGVYIHKWLFNHLLSMIDDDYALTIDEIVDLMDEELKLRNMTLEQKISEQEKTIETLKIKREESNRGHNNETPGCIFLRKSKTVPNAYKIWSSEIKKIHDKTEHTINDVFNSKFTLSEFNFYARHEMLDGIKWKSYCVIEIDDFDAVDLAIKQIQEFKVRPPSIEYLVNQCLNR